MKYNAKPPKFFGSKTIFWLKEPKRELLMISPYISKIEDWNRIMTQIWSIRVRLSSRPPMFSHFDKELKYFLFLRQLDLYHLQRPSICNNLQSPLISERTPNFDPQKENYAYGACLPTMISSVFSTASYYCWSIQWSKAGAPLINNDLILSLRMRQSWSACVLVKLTNLFNKGTPQ